ncbi:MAG: hypothetical protein Q9P90_13895 [candidate division KSB1 bacterium]|nr:hypothetical protein [candidate division KSB1 bacterium]
MKKALLFLLALALCGLLSLRFLPLPWLEPAVNVLPERLVLMLRPELMPPETVDIPPPEPRILEEPQPLWLGVKEKLKQMVSVYKFDSNDALKADLKINQFNYLAAGADFIATADVYDSEMIIFSPKLQFVRRWPMLTGIAKKMARPFSLAAFEDRIAALNRSGEIAIWDMHGRRLGRFRVKDKARDLAFLDRDRLLVVQTQPYPHVLAVYTLNGRKLKQFCPIDYPNPDEAEFLNEAYVSISRRGRLALGFIHPYRLIFFDTSHRPERQLIIHPKFTVQPPIFRRQHGRIVQMVRQSIIYDVQWFQERLYVLVTPDQAKPASYMDVFSPKGDFLERFYLPFPTLKMAVHGDFLYMIGYWPNYRIEAFRIEAIDDRS